jgi:predicted nucleic acid-binding protein
MFLAARVWALTTEKVIAASSDAIRGFSNFNLCTPQLYGFEDHQKAMSRSIFIEHACYSYAALIIMELVSIIFCITLPTHYLNIQFMAKSRMGKAAL